MLKLNPKELALFQKQGYIKLDLFKNDYELNRLMKNFKLDLNSFLQNTNISKIGGYRAGNLNINPGKHGPMIMDYLLKKNFKEYFEYLINDNLSNYRVIYGGNLNLPKSKNQLFHTDGNWAPRMVILNIATCGIDTSNGPMEVIKYSRKQHIPYWFFLLRYFLSKNKKKLILDKGEIIIREHRLWHRGTRNKSLNNREMLGIMFLKNKTTMKQQEIDSLKVYNNMYDLSLKGKLKEFIFLYFKFFLVLYKLIISLKK